MDSVNILVLEDHPVTARGIKEFLTALLLGQFAAQIETINPAEKANLAGFKADIVVISINPRSIYPLIFDKLRKANAWEPKKIIVYCDKSEFRAGLDFLYKGINGFVLKESAPDQLIRCIESTLAGQPYVCQKAIQKIIAHFMPDSKITINPGEAGFPLTMRELEIAREISRGLRVTEIARRLRITPGRVSICKTTIYKKLGIKDHHELSSRLFELSAAMKNT